MFPRFLSHFFTFLLGLIGTAIYFDLFVSGPQNRYFLERCTFPDGGSLRFNGDWTLDILFPAVPLVLLIASAWTVMKLLRWLQKEKNKQVT